MKIQILAWAFTLSFLINGCTQTVYQETPGPKLQTHKVEKKEFPPLKIQYEVK